MREDLDRFLLEAPSIEGKLTEFCRYVEDNWHRLGTKKDWWVSLLGDGELPVFPSGNKQWFALEENKSGYCVTQFVDSEKDERIYIPLISIPYKKNLKSTSNLRAEIARGLESILNQEDTLLKLLTNSASKDGSVADTHWVIRHAPYISVMNKDTIPVSLAIWEEVGFAVGVIAETTVLQSPASGVDTLW